MRTLLAVLMMIALAFAGCSSPAEDDGTETDPGGDGNDGEGQGNEGTGGGQVAPGTYLVNVSADQSTATVPAEITFLIELIELNDFDNQTFYDSYSGPYTFSFDFGDGETESGDGEGGFIDLTHNYQVGGSYNATASVDMNGTMMEGVLAMTLITPEPPRELPEPSTFSYDATLGCAGDVGTCIGIVLVTTSPEPFTPEEATGIDGNWQALDERYWGLLLDSTAGNVLGDSDCEFYDENFVSTGAANNGQGPCNGRVPMETAWLYIWSYAEPSTGQTVTFTL